MKKLTRGALVGGTFLLPMLALAQNTTQLFNWVGAIRTLINALIPIALALIFLMIIWNAYKLITVQTVKKNQNIEEISSR
jgi:hypothetical protein